MENTGFSVPSKNSFVKDSKRIWNLALKPIKEAATLNSAKKGLKPIARTYQSKI